MRVLLISKFIVEKCLDRSLGLSSVTLELESSFSSEWSFLLTGASLENQRNMPSSMQYVSVSPHSNHKGEIIIFL